MPLPLNATHADVLPLCLIGNYDQTSGQVNVGWRCGWLPTEAGYEFTIERLYGDHGDRDVLFPDYTVGAIISGDLLIRDKRYFSILEIAPFKVYDDAREEFKVYYDFLADGQARVAFLGERA